MKTAMKNYKIHMLLFTIAVLVLTACVKEEPGDTSANFTTNISNNTLGTGAGFTVYLDNASGDFLTYFKGDTEESTYGNQGAAGIAIDADSDSVVVSGYSDAGTYTFTLVARSFGNWSEDIAEDAQSITITVQ